MIFKTLKDKCEYYRSLTDYRLIPNGYAIMMLDGRSFSKFIKNNFKKPFDNDFVRMMNETAEYVCKNISGAQVGFVQSDEISIVISDTSESEPWFGWRMCKLLSIGAALATAKFNQLLQEHWISGDYPLIQFDCKVWNVPNVNEAYAWLLYRQYDCVRNSKQQTAQTWLSHKKLEGLDTDKQIALLKEEQGIDWNTFADGLKYGRIIFKTSKTLYNPQGEPYVRAHWGYAEAKPFGEELSKAMLLKLIDAKIAEVNI